jgi:hypothetical protein
VELYNLKRATADIDVLPSTGTHLARIVELAGKGSQLHKKHRVYIDVVTVATVPEDYESRLLDLDLETSFKKLHLKAFERHDLVLAKLSRNIDRDREDVQALARDPGLDVSILKDRYAKELRYQVSVPEHEDLTLALWVEMIEEVMMRTKRPSSR